MPAAETPVPVLIEEKRSRSKSQTKLKPEDRLLISIREAAYKLGVGRHTVMRMMKDGRLGWAAIGSRRLPTLESVEAAAKPRSL
jgi:excisionase family DNA binding protein